jgi:integrase
MTAPSWVAETSSVERLLSTSSPTASDGERPETWYARLALALLLYTAQRRSDVVRMGRLHVRNCFIYIKQSKTGTKLSIPMHPELQRVIEESNVTGLTFLATAAGAAFTPAGFTNWFRDCCKDAELKGRRPPTFSAAALPVARNRCDHFTTLATLTPKVEATARHG